MSSPTPRRGRTRRTVRIPRHWSGDEALAFVAFLENITHAVWDAHGPKMAACLQRADDLQSAWINSPSYVQPADAAEDDDGEIPF